MRVLPSLRGSWGETRPGLLIDRTAAKVVPSTSLFWLGKRCLGRRKLGLGLCFIPFIIGCDLISQSSQLVEQAFATTLLGRISHNARNHPRKFLSVSS